MRSAVNRLCSDGRPASAAPTVCRSRVVAIAATYAHSRSAAYAGLYHFMRSRARMLTLVLTGSITIDVALTALYNYPLAGSVTALARHPRRHWPATFAGHI